MVKRAAGHVLAAALAAATWPSPAQSRGYVLEKNYMNDDFFSNFWFWKWPDLTHGHVRFVDEFDARESGMIGATRDRVYMSADRWTHLADGEKRKSVKIYSNDVYNAGLFVISLDHLPTGCGTWPAFWMTGGNSKEHWPSWGEYDIIEGTHYETKVATALHTDQGCSQSGMVAGRDFRGAWQAAAAKPAADNCDVHAEGQWKNQGCSQFGPEGSMGPAFNARGGGTYAAQWAPLDGGGGFFRTWFWLNGTEPADLKAGSPNPDSWGLPYSHYNLSPESCPQSHFKNMRLVFDLTFCGDMAGSNFGQKCPAEAAQMSCEQLVSQHPEKLKEAFWSIRRLETYQWQEDVVQADRPLWAPAATERLSCERIGCDGGFVPGQSCQCDSDCLTFRNCCFDAHYVCNVHEELSSFGPPPPGPAEPPPPHQGTDILAFLKRFSVASASRMGLSVSDRVASVLMLVVSFVGAVSFVVIGVRVVRAGGQRPHGPSHSRLLQVASGNEDPDVPPLHDRQCSEEQILLHV